MRQHGGRWIFGGLPHPPAMGLLSHCPPGLLYLVKLLTSPPCWAPYAVVRCSEHLLALHVLLRLFGFPPA